MLRTSFTQVTFFPIIVWVKSKLRKFSTIILLPSTKNHTRSKCRSNLFFIIPSSHFVHQSQRVGQGCFWNHSVQEFAIVFLITEGCKSYPIPFFVSNVSLLCQYLFSADVLFFLRKRRKRIGGVLSRLGYSRCPVFAALVYRGHRGL